MGEPEAPAPRGAADVYFLLVAASNLVTALVPSETACLASSPGRMRRTAVWTSRELSVCFLEKPAHVGEASFCALDQSPG